MKTFETKFIEYLQEQGYEYAQSEREIDDLSDKIVSQRKGLNSSQREEVMMIFERFFDNADEMEFSDSLYPIIKLKSEVKVPHLAIRKFASMAYYAETMITQRFDELQIGGEFNVNVEYFGTYDCGEQVPSDFEVDSAMDHYMVTIELELF